MFEHLSDYDLILVTGPQRSGTTIAARMIAADTGLRYVDEGMFGSHLRDRFLKLITETHGIVVHCPAMAYTIHELAIPDGALIVYMMRPIAEIIASQERVEWRAADELAKWPGSSSQSVSQSKYDLWEKQKPLISNWLELDYHDLEDHPLWLPKEQREHFGARQWREHNLAVVIPAVDPDYVEEHLDEILGVHGITGSLDVLIVDDRQRTQFTKTVNRGLTQVPPRADYIAILSDDVRPVSTLWLDGLCSQLDSHPAFGYVCPAMPCHTDFINQHAPVEHPEARIVLACPFGCVVIKRETLAQVGPLDEWLLHYASDTDHQLRGHELGWFSVCDQGAFVMRDMHTPTQPQWSRDRSRYAKKWGIEVLVRNRDPRILYIDTFGVAIAEDKTAGITAAYEQLGNAWTFDYRAIAEKVGVWEMNAELIELALWYRPTYIHLGLCESIRGHTIRRIKQICGAYVLHIYGDVRDEPLRSTLDLGQYVDVTYLSNADEKQKQMHLDGGCQRIEPFFIGVDTDVFKPNGATPEYDVAFMGWVDGHPIGKQRRALIQAMADAGFSVRVFGCTYPLDIEEVDATLEPIIGHDYARECAKARIVLNMCDDRWRLYTSWPRVWRTLASGGFLLTNYFPGMEEVLESGTHAAPFWSISDAVRTAQYYLDRPPLRDMVAAQGMALARESYNWDAAIGRLWDAADPNNEQSRRGQ